MIPICAASKGHGGVIPTKKKSIDQRALSIDISDQQFRLLPPEVLAARDTIEHLIADGNAFNENALKMPQFPKLKTLTLNQNKIRNISTLLQNISTSCPNLQTLTLTGNPGWPETSDTRKYKHYRKATVKMIPKLRNLDGICLNRKVSTASSGFVSSGSSISGSSDSLDTVESICSE